MIIYQKIIKREDLWTNTKVLYVFGDNEKRKGYGGQAAEMRGEPNAVGVRTKKSPTEFWSDETYGDNVKMINDDLKPIWKKIFHEDAVVIFPYDGIGTGLSELPRRAPLTYQYVISVGLGPQGRRLTSTLAQQSESSKPQPQ